MRGLRYLILFLVIITCISFAAAETLVLQPVPSQIEDSYVPDDGGFNDGTRDSSLGIAYTYGCNRYQARGDTFIKFYDLGSIPNGAEIEKVSIELYSFNVATPGTAEVKKVLQYWDEVSLRGSWRRWTWH